MAKANFVKSARKPIYIIGKRVSYVSQKGKREGQTISKTDRTQPNDENDKILINIGESYWWWAFQYGGTHYSKERPKASQLTQSNFLSQYYEFQERISEVNFITTDEVESFVDDLKSDMENLKEECQNSLDSMPEHLQESSSSGEILTERIEEMDNLISELEGIDCDYDGSESDEKAIGEWLSDKLEEIQNMSFNL